MFKKTTVYSSDPNAIEKLTEKKEKREAYQEYMKGVNAHWRSTGSCSGAPNITEERAKEIDNRIAKASDFWDKVPYNGHFLQLNYNEIKRLEQRINEISRNRELGFSGWKFNGGYAEANKELNRLQLFFDEKPTEAQCKQLLLSGFSWIAYRGAWQRKLNSNAIYAAGSIDFIKPSDGSSVRDHQYEISTHKAEAR